MNENIKKLIEQTDIYCDQHWLGSPFYEVKWEEKFAELLIKESIGVVNKRYMGDNNREDFEVRRCVEDLKKHFVTKDENSKITDEEWYWAIK